MVYGVEELWIINYEWNAKKSVIPSAAEGSIHDTEIVFTLVVYGLRMMDHWEIFNMTPYGVEEEYTRA